MKAILPASTMLPMGMSESISPDWGDATVLQLGQSSWDSGAYFNLHTEI